MPTQSKTTARFTRANLDAIIPWRIARLCLEIPGSSSDLLPQTTACPFCKGPITAYQVNPGIWLHCERCRWSGSIIELAGRIWSLDPLAVLQKFSALGLNLHRTAL